MISTAPNVRDIGNNTGGASKTASSTSKSALAKMLDSPSPLDRSAVIDFDDDMLTPIVVSPLEPHETAHYWGPGSVRGSPEYKQWFNNILLHDLDACIAQIQTYAKDKRRTAYAEDVDREVREREHALCTHLLQLQCEIKAASQVTRKVRNPVMQEDTSKAVADREKTQEVEIWMDTKSHLAAELFCSYDEAMRRACGTWQMGGIEEARGQIRRDWRAEGNIEELLGRYRQICMR